MPSDKNRTEKRKRSGLQGLFLLPLLVRLWSAALFLHGRASTTTTLMAIRWSDKTQ